jgi:hypothetical protein
MITQELLGYIRAEVAKGKTREEIHKALISGGGWSEDDLSEAFRTIIPMPGVVLPNPVASLLQREEKPSQPAPAVSFSPSSPRVSFSSPPLRSFSPPSTYSPSPSLLKPTPLSKPTSSSRSLSSLLKFLIILIIIVGLGFGAWYYRSQITSLWNLLVNKVSNLYTPSVGTNNTTNSTPNTDSNNQATAPNPIIQPVAQVKDCGTTTTPKLDVPSSYENNPVLSCLGASAVNCENAKGVLKDDFFPTIFEITKSTQSPNYCDFKLSYGADSTLTDITGKNLALQYISCPIDIVKAIDNTKPATPKFITPDPTDLSKYASQIYLYGTLGLFVENNLDQNKIYTLGCSGEYIQSVIASYRLTHK